MEQHDLANASHRQQEAMLAAPHGSQVYGNDNRALDQRGHSPRGPRTAHPPMTTQPAGGYGSPVQPFQRQPAASMVPAGHMPGMHSNLPADAPDIKGGVASPQYNTVASQPGAGTYLNTQGTFASCATGSFPGASDSGGYDQHHPRHQETALVARGAVSSTQPTHIAQSEHTAVMAELAALRVEMAQVRADLDVRQDVAELKQAMHSFRTDFTTLLSGRVETVCGDFHKLTEIVEKLAQKCEAHQQQGAIDDTSRTLAPISQGRGGGRENKTYAQAPAKTKRDHSHNVVKPTTMGQERKEVQDWV